jgi:hypothetical protein
MPVTIAAHAAARQIHEKLESKFSYGELKPNKCKKKNRPERPATTKPREPGKES